MAIAVTDRRMLCFLNCLSHGSWDDDRTLGVLLSHDTETIK